MLQNKIITNDDEKRHEFKERVQQRVTNALTPKQSEVSTGPIDVEIPVNFFQITETELFGILRQKVTSNQAVEVVEQLQGRSPRTEEFRFVLMPPVVIESEPQSEPIIPVIPVVDVELPTDFTTYRLKDQYAYLTKERAMAPETANDIVDLLAGKTPFARVEYRITYSDAQVFPNPLAHQEPVALAPIALTVPHDFASQSRSWQEMSLTREYGLTLVEARDVLKTLDNQPTDRLVSLTIEESPVVQARAVEAFPSLEVELPVKFGNLRPQDQYMYLKTQLRLTSDQANDVLFVFNGNKPMYSNVTIKDQRITMPEAPADVVPSIPAITLTLPHDFAARKRVYQEMALTRDYGLSLTDAQDVLRALRNEPVKREVNLTVEQAPEAVPVTAHEFPEIEVELPAEFATLRTSDQFVYLKNQLQLTGEQANDVMSAFYGQIPVHNKVTITELEQEPQVWTEPLPPSLPPITLTLPHDFASQKRAYQEMTLTREYGLSLAEAQEVLQALEDSQ